MPSAASMLGTSAWYLVTLIDAILNIGIVFMVIIVIIAIMITIVIIIIIVATIHVGMPRTACACVREPGQHWFRYWLITCSVGSEALRGGEIKSSFLSPTATIFLFIISGTNLNDSRLVWWYTDRKNLTPYIKLTIYFYGSYTSAATVMQSYYFDYRICTCVIIVYLRKRTLQWMYSYSLPNRFYRKSESMIFVSSVRTKFRPFCFTNGDNWFSDRFPRNSLGHLGLTMASIHLEDAVLSV